MSDTRMVRTIREQVVDRLRADVMSGRIGAGESLRETQLAERFGTSRGPIRDALLQLTQEGLLVSRPNCGVRVGCPPDGALSPLLFELRHKLEVHALGRIMDELDDADDAGGTGGGHSGIGVAAGADKRCDRPVVRADGVELDVRDGDPHCPPCARLSNRVY